MAFYLVEGPNETKRLIETRTKAGAINHVAQGLFKATALKNKELVQHLKAGLVPETIEDDNEDDKAEKAKSPELSLADKKQADEPAAQTTEANARKPLGLNIGGNKAASGK